ncbi:MAG TPA: M1 family metallopeptidase [Thermoanaerobaculia bacterium]|nr:M1 family metallopeptidase [Thermoanaerobaculia bacterium]
MARIPELHLVASLLFALPALLCACAGTPPPAPPVAAAAPAPPAVDDPHSSARPQEVAVEHLALDLTVDFDRKQLAGRASLRLRNPAGATRLYLDTRDLEIRRVLLDSGTEARFTLGDPQPHLGRELAVEIAPGTRTVHVDYATSPEAAALQWLEPRQTSGEQPFLFTQSQAILARTWIPLQDTPGVRATYEATIRVPPGFLALMSAENPTAKSADGVYRFRMPQPVPSYLLALAVGDLAFRPLGDRAGVYAEPAVVERAAWELADTPKMIQAAEKLYGPYRWGRYDVLVLPPSFPFGGMENPRLTFATPTILAGDRSLVALVAHELAHSWSGNLVTNATWNDFWLNEGFTVYFENRIMEAIYGRPYSEMLAALGRGDLLETIEELGAESPDTRLKLDLAGRDPDDGVTDVAYDKGYLLLRRIEEVVGRPRFDKFLRSYFERHAFGSMDTETFLGLLDRELLAEQAELRDEVRQWVYQPGLPATAPQPRADAFAKVEAQAQAFAAGTAAAALQTQGWSTHEWLHFLRSLPSPVAADRMADLDQTFKLSESGNSEVLAAWLEKVIASSYAPAYPALERFLTGMGRRKFLQPLYTALAKSPAGAELALRIYEKARPGYHAVSRQTIDKILDWRG